MGTFSSLYKNISLEASSEQGVIITSPLNPTIDIPTEEDLKRYYSKISKLIHLDLCIELSNVMAAKYNLISVPFSEPSSKQRVISDLNDKAITICILSLGQDAILTYCNDDIPSFIKTIDSLDKKVAERKLVPSEHGNKLLTVLKMTLNLYNKEMESLHATPKEGNSEKLQSGISLDYKINSSGGIEFQNKDETHCYAENYIKGYYKDNYTLSNYLHKIVNIFLEIVTNGSISILNSEYICSGLSELVKKGHLSFKYNNNLIVYALSEPMKKMLVFTDKGGRNDSNQYFDIMKGFREIQKKYQILPKKTSEN